MCAHKLFVVRLPGLHSARNLIKAEQEVGRVPIPNSPPARFRSLVAVGSKIYNIVICTSPYSFSKVSILDCTSNTWREAPSMRVELHSISASVLDHKIYVAGRDASGKNLLEIFDTETQIWDSVPYETEEFFFKERSASIDGKFHVVINEEVLAYDAKQGKWDMVGQWMGFCMVSSSYCVIGNVLYSAFEGEFRWYDTEVRLWRYLQGLVRLPNITRHRGIRLGDYGGKMVVFWDQDDWPFHSKTIWCAQIALERRNTSEIWGNVEWFDHFLKINSAYQVEKVLATTL